MFDKKQLPEPALQPGEDTLPFQKEIDTDPRFFKDIQARPCRCSLQFAEMAVGQNECYHFGVAHPFQSISVGIGMFTGGWIWILTHGQMNLPGDSNEEALLGVLVLLASKTGSRRRIARNSLTLESPGGVFFPCWL